MTNTATIDAQARELHRQHSELCKRVERLTRACAYGNGSNKERYETCAERDDVFHQLLTLRGVAFSEWVTLNEAQRKEVWGFRS